MKTIEGSIASPRGFQATGAHIGLKKASKDLCLIVSDVKAVAAGCFTTNIVKAAPVMWDMNVIGNDIKGIVVNSGNANACTGDQGMKDTETMADTFAQLIGCNKEEVLVCSTGVIGVNLPMEKLTAGMASTFPSLGSTLDDGLNAARAIMTTDTFMKNICVQTEIGGKTVTIASMAKGSGMIHPNMATMLSFVTTDVSIDRSLLQKALKDVVSVTYNMISVDGDMSTNDTILALANGMADNATITEENDDYKTFVDALLFVTRTLAKEVARDGEGATKLLEVCVNGAKTYADAATISKSVVSSNLFKAALFGEDANWGRVLCAMGYSGASFDPSQVTIAFRSEAGTIALMEKGTPIAFDEAKASEILALKEIFVDIQLAEGSESAVAWGCDLTYDYVKINGDYRS